MKQLYCMHINCTHRTHLLTAKAMDAIGQVDFCFFVFDLDRLCRTTFRAAATAHAIARAHMRTRRKLWLNPANQNSERRRNIICEVEPFRIRRQKIIERWGQSAAQDNHVLPIT